MSIAHREAILQAATDVFARVGFKRAFVDEIARRAGVAKGTVYLHFESKETLFAAAFQHVWSRVHDELTATVRAAATPAGKLQAFCSGFRDQAVTVARTLHASEEAALELIPLAKPYLGEVRNRQLALLEEILTEGVASGDYVIREPHLIAVGLLGYLEALVYSVSPAGPGSEALRSGTDEFVEVVQRGLAA
ncbi:MAG TPA: TetR/AcrR family transcriptional regulator [Anaeromyxobacteraceae bacterium]|nr:TetR/AcrR family transcriptional regulator [Anaeromyxobacteraceae bacterium]